ncbi:hypothetical protein DWU98_21520, partial [Dyella monticola]
CKVPTEWAADGIEQRYAWLKRTQPFVRTGEQNQTPTLNETQWAAFEAHVRALCFWEQAKQAGHLDLDAVHWHVDPREFIKQFRKCGWLSVEELAQLMPRRPSGMTWDTAEGRLRRYQIDLNKCSQKYLLGVRERLAQFLAQIYAETDRFRTIEEDSRGVGYTYGSFYGRGLMQLTWAENYDAYGKYRNFPANPSRTYQGTGSPGDPITSTSMHEWAPPIKEPDRTIKHDRRLWAPRYDPALIASDTYNACDSAGYFWITKHYMGTSNINRLVDEGFSTDTVGKTNVLVNGGSNSYNERQGYAAYIYWYLSDSIQTDVVQQLTSIQQLTFARYGIEKGRWIANGVASHQVDYTPQRPNR